MLKIFSNLCVKNNIIHRMNYRGRGGGRRGYIRDRPGNHDQEEGGHNNWRGHRQRRQGQRQYDDERQGHRQYDDGRQGHRQYDDGNHDRRDFRGRGRGRGGRPPGLRGKEIGLFYARQGKEKKQREEIEQRPEVSMQGKEDHIQKMLADIENLESDDKLSSGASFSGSDKTDDVTQEDEVTEVPDLDQMFKLTQQEQDLILEEWDEEMDTSEEDEISLDDQKMIKDLNDKSKNSRYLRMMEFRKKLPSYNMREAHQPGLNICIHATSILALEMVASYLAFHLSDLFLSLYREQLKNLRAVLWLDDAVIIMRTLSYGDFGHFLGNKKTKFNINRERVPFILTSHFEYIIKDGEKKPQNFTHFKEICERAYLIIRSRAHLLIQLFMMMLSSGIPQLNNVSDIDYIKEVLALNSTQEEALEKFRKKFKEAQESSWSTTVNWWFHMRVH
ncbi:PIK3CA_B_D [Mytilus edulis]|uniref:PIK3CA_B_D n=1 Tax=Mytilus edulis TaxID=6550 RepID=A0A8S3THF7_MYTED|nr:PIK3CA_B_D [Mytilus edulis]